MKPGPPKGYRPHKTVTLRVKSYRGNMHGGQHFEGTRDVAVTGVERNAGTPFSYWEYQINEGMLDITLGLGDVHWEPNWDRSRWYASNNGQAIASVQVLDNEYSKEDVKTLYDN